MWVPRPLPSRTEKVCTQRKSLRGKKPYALVPLVDWRAYVGAPRVVYAFFFLSFFRQAGL